MRCRLCWFHSPALSPTWWRTQELIFIYWQKFLTETSLLPKESWKEFQCFKEMQKQVWLPRVWNDFLLTNWDQVSMYNLTPFVHTFLIICMPLLTPSSYLLAHTFTSQCLSLYIYIYLCSNMLIFTLGLCCARYM